MTITPYGFLLTQAFWNDGPFSQKDGGFQALANHDGGAFIVAARGSRMGLRVGLPSDPWTGAAVNGTLEFDFKAGQLPSTAYTVCPATASAGNGYLGCTSTLGAPSTSYYNAVPRLRLAYMTAAWGDPTSRLTLLAGQDWGLIAPLTGTSLAWGMDPLFNRAGNVWRRSPQFKATFEAGGPVLGGSIAAAILSPADSNIANADVFPAYSADYGAGNRSRIPNLEARVALWYKQGATKVFELGLSGHYDKRRYSRNNVDTATGTQNLSFQNVDVEGKVVAADLVVNVPYATVQGEFFFNDGAGDTINAIAPSAVVTNATATAWKVYTVQSRGGWVQLVLKPIKQLQIPVGYGFEQVNTPKGSGLAATTNTRNSEFVAGVMFNVTNPWKFGFEFMHTLSTYGLQTTAFARSAEANQYGLSSKLDF